MRILSKQFKQVAIAAIAISLYACTSATYKLEPKKLAAEKITKDNFEALMLKAEEPVLVDFYADWCLTCNWLDDDMPNLMEYFDGKMMFYKFDVMTGEETAKRYDARTLPAIRIFYNGDVICKTSGYGGGKDYDSLKAILEKCLESTKK